MQLPLVQRLKLVRQRVYAACGYDGNVVVRLEEAPDGLYARVHDGRVAIPHPLLWKMYRWGWEGRLARLAAEYGVGTHFELTPNSLVLDVGANAGEFAHICARAGARVHCFEPDPGVFACLQKNVAGLEGVTLHDCVIWKEDGEVEFGLAPERSDSSVFVTGNARVKKRAVRIETFIRDNAIGRVDLVKCDAEGAEPEMLEGVGAAFEIIRGFAIDTGPERNGERTNIACAEILRRNGFRVFDELVRWRQMTFAVNERFA